ncbi:MAG TPA: hypothetical protein VK973_08845 [Arenicellales bacterium]|nr:hypothetical protein [Arenicellales bacterium]
MLRLNGLFSVVAVLAALWLLPFEASRAVHFLGHGLETEPSGQQIEQFCKQYRSLVRAPNTTTGDQQKYKKLHRQYCEQPVAAPAKPAVPATPDKEPGMTPQPRLGRIERIQPPACLGRGSEIHVRGENLRDGGLDCRLEAGGRRQSLQAYSRTAQEFRFRLGDLRPGPDYVLQCEVDGDRERISLEGCDGPVAPAGAADVDLAAEIRAGVLRPGATQMVEVLIPNRGRSGTPRNERYRVMLALVDRDLTRTVGMKMGSRGSLVEKNQWMIRVPAAGQSERVSIAINVPARLPDPGSLHWCAFADHDGHIEELNERNNLACVPASGGTQAVARDDLSKLFGSAVRNQNPGVRIREEQRVTGEGDSSAVPRTLMHEGDGGQPGIAAGEVDVDLEEQLPLPDVPDMLDGRPDLAVTGFRLASWGSCDPDEYTMFTFEVTVANLGTAPAAVPRINAADMHEGHNWGNGAVLGDAPLWPGESRTGSIIVGTVGEPTTHMMEAAPHPFMAMVNAGNAAGEPDALNNYYATLINVDPRPLCGSVIAGEAPEGIHETSTLDTLGLDPAALETRVAALPSVQRDNEALPDIEAGSLGDRNLGSRADAIEQANQARGLKDLTEAMRGGLAVPGFEGGGQDPLKPGGVDLAHRDTDNPLDRFGDRASGEGGAGSPFGDNHFMPEPTAPRNQEGETPNAGRGGNSLIPSMNPRDWASGARTQDGDEGSGGGDVIQMDPVEIDTRTTVRTERGANGSKIVIYTEPTEDGGSFVEVRTEDREGNWIYTRQIRADGDGNVVSDRTRGVDQPRWEPGPMDPRGNPDPNDPGYSHAFARWHSQFDHSKKKGAPIINRVNPGPDGATPDPKGPHLRVPEHQLTGNPSPEAWGGGERPMTREEAERFREELQEKVRGPGGHPGDEGVDDIHRP